MRGGTGHPNHLLSRDTVSSNFQGGRRPGKLGFGFIFFFFFFLLCPFLATIFFAGYFLVRFLLSVFPAFFFLSDRVPGLIWFGSAYLVAAAVVLDYQIRSGSVHSVR